MEEKFCVSEDVFVTVGEFQGKKRIDLRKWYTNKAGEMSRGKNGLNIDEDGWNDLKVTWNDLVEWIEKKIHAT